MAYHRFRNWDDGHEYGSFETFYVDATDPCIGDDDSPAEAGWYWWPCLVGCLPDSDAIGPFGSEYEAIADAQGSG